MSIFEEYQDLNDEAFVLNYDLDNCFTVRNDERAINALDLAVAILRYEGNLSGVAKQLAKPRRRIEAFIMNHVNLRDLFDDVEAEFLDDIEFKLRDTAKLGDPGVIKFFLTTKGKSRGFTTRSEVGGNDGKPIEVDVNDSRTLLSAKLNAILERRGAAEVRPEPDADGSGSTDLGLALLGETEPASTGGRDVADVGSDGGPGVREDEDGGGVGS